MNLMKSMPFKLAVAFTALYLLCFSVGSAIYYKGMHLQMEESIDRTLIERHQIADDLYKELGIDAVAQVVNAKGHTPMGYSMGFHLATADGERIAGNVPTCNTEVGFVNIHGSELGMEIDQYYRFYTAKLGENIFSLGRSMEPLDELRRYSLNSYFATFAATTLLALLGAVVLAYRSHRRVRAIVTSMDSVATGNLQARLPISRRGDDIDQLAGNMNYALTLLQQQVNGMKQVSADIAHDLKTPLNRLYIHIEQAAEKCRAGLSVEAELEDAIEEAEDINGTFEALLRIAQIEARARKAQFVAMDLLPTLQTAVEVYEPVAEEQGQKVELILEPSVGYHAGLHMMGDKALLLQMVVNLIENAIRHCPAQTVIQVRTGITDGIVWMEVVDNGPGIPAELRDQVFRRLYRLESSRTTPGSGLGLSLVKAVADLHCGTVTLADNEPGLIVRVAFDRDCPVD